MIDLKHWDVFDSFTFKQAACLIAGIEPSHQEIEVWSMALMKEHYTNAVVFSQSGGFDPLKYGDSLLPTDLQSIGLQAIRYKVRSTTYQAEFFSWVNTEGEIEHQKFSRFELSRWIKAKRVSSKYQFHLHALAASDASGKFSSDPEIPKLSPAAISEQRCADRWRVCVEANLKMPTDTYAPFPRGIGEVAKKLNIARQTLTSDLNKHRERMFAVRKCL